MLELTILIPCLNEEDTIGKCINKAKTCMKKNKIKGEVLIIDNGSTDNSVKISRRLGARVILETKNKGYGLALRKGIINAKGKFIIMGDADADLGDSIYEAKIFVKGKVTRSPVNDSYAFLYAL